MSNVSATTPLTDSKPTEASRHVYRSLDAWRGIAALWVLGSHAVGLLGVIRPGVRHELYSLVLAQGFLGVEIFFVISGYCIAAAMASALKRAQPEREFGWARIRRIFPPYWAALGLLLVIMAIWRQANPFANPPSWELIPVSHLQPVWVYVTNVTLTQIAVGHSTLLPIAWTLSYEVGFYLICGLVLVTLGVRKPQWAFDALHGLTLVTAGLCAAGFWRLIFPLDMWAYFGVGVLLFDVLRGTSRRKHAILLIASCVLLGAFALLHRGARVGSMDHPALKSVAMILVTVLGLWGVHRWDAKLAAHPVIKILGMVGVFSYSLYLVHYYVIGFAVLLMGDTMSKLPSIAEVVVLCVLGIVTAYGFFWCVERPMLLSKEKKQEKSGATDAATVANVS